jgi:hypothetical protein
MAAFVQVGIGSNDGKTAVTGTGGTGFPGSTTAGNSIIVGVSWGSTAGLTGVTDNKSNTYTQRVLITGASRSLAIYDCLAPATMGAGHTVTLTLPANDSDLQIIAHEVSGLASFAAVVSDNAEAGTAVDTPATTPGSDGAYLFGHVRAASLGTFVPNTGTNTWVERGEVNHGGDTDSQTQDFVQATAASIACEWTMSSTNNCICAMASYLASGGAAFLPRPNGLPGQAVKRASVY